MDDYNIKDTRIKLRLNQQDFATKLGVSLSAVANWENGRSSPSRLAREKIVQVIKENSDANESIEQESS